MYSREEAAQIRKEFWMAFDAYSRKFIGAKQKWITYNTGLKDIVLKFDLDRNRARVMLLVEHRNEDKRFDIFVRIKGFEMLYEDNLGEGWIWDEQLMTNSGKEVCAIYKQLDDVNIYNKNQWTDIFDFFGIEMMKIESAFLEFKPLIKDYINTNF
ncbi:MAG: DUF4268 domain-containing protein [Marinilabiliales bacterium]|nr:MAG: DUF4268 domain-containing protein [Marinilabiliales bacterium]